MSWLDIKAGSIILDKQYNWFKRTWAKLTKKELPYNLYMIAHCDMTVMVDKWLILEPRKCYSKIEKRMLETYVDKLFVFDNDQRKLAKIVNEIRGCTINGFLPLSSLLENKYYKVVHDPKKEEL